MTKITIEKAEKEDLDTLHEIERECFKENAFPKHYLTCLFLQKNSIFLKAKINNKIAGFAVGVTQPHYNQGRIYTLDVKTEHRRRGIATKLLQALEAEFKQRGATTSTLEVDVKNQPALKLYQKSGYKTKTLIKNYYGHNRHAAKMTKKL